MGEVREDGDGVNRRYRAVLCGYYGFGNLGDELLASALVEAFEKIGVPRD